MVPGGKTLWPWSSNMRTSYPGKAIWPMYKFISMLFLPTCSNTCGRSCQSRLQWGRRSAQLLGSEDSRLVADSCSPYSPRRNPSSNASAPPAPQVCQDDHDLEKGTVP